MADAFVRTLRQVFRRQGAAPCAVFLWAAERGHVGIVRNLLQGLRRDKSAHAVYASEALQRAAAEGHADVVSLLIAEVPYPVPNFLQKACRWAIYGGHTQAAKVIIADTRFDANVTNRDDVSLLQLAARLGEAEIVDTLVSRIERDNGLAANRSGILLALPEEEGGTNIPRELSQALRTAKIYGHNAVIEMLSQHGIVEPSREATSGTAIRLPVHQGGASPALQPAAS
ncbi:ankyrin repeat domain-containing protein [Propionivibrio sp.]|uniref:ankyrin repeat domain-containing protein n=1 Tax=Propionivibrio sp. TaxID=2212460 RepID=UPI00260A0DF7|nr:ankyrin repeat domain-containing protein [Propionivibrio sp.]